MINIIQRGGIHRTKHEFGPFNRKYRPKRNKKRAMIVHRGVYSEHSFSGLNRPSRGRHLKTLERHPFLARQGLKRAAWKWRSLGRLIGEQVAEVSNRKGFTRRLFEAQADPNTLFSPEALKKVIEGPVPHFEVKFVDEKFCFLDILEPEVILELYADIVSRMPEGMIPQVGDYQSFDPSDKDGTTGSRVRMHNGKIVEVQRLPTKWEGPYKNWDKPAPVPGPFSGFNRHLLRLQRDRVLQPGEAIVCLPDGTFEPFLGRGATPHYGEPYEEDYVDTLSIAFGLPNDFLDPRYPERQSMGFKCKMPANGDQNVQRDLDVSNREVRVRDKVPGRTIEYLAPGLNFITDTIHRSIEGELLDPVGKGWRIVKASKLLNLRLPIEGETVNETDTNKEVKMTDKKRDILHVVLEDGLNLTVDQMTEVTKAFAGVVADPEANVVVTASGISVKILTVEEGQDIRSTSIVLDNETWNRVWAAKDIAETTVVTTHESVTLTPEWPEGAECAARIDSTAPVEDCIATHPAHPGHDDIDAAIAESQAELDNKDKQ